MDIFAEVQENFMELGILLSGYDLDKDLEKEEVLATIEDALKEANKSFEKGLCDKAYMCSKCTQTGEELHRLVALIDSCVKDKRINAEAKVALIEFTYKIPAILSELKNVYLESLSKRAV